MKKIARLHFITQDLLAQSHLEQAVQAIEAGVKWVQFRSKILRGTELIEQAVQIKNACQQRDVTFIINDDPMLAKQLLASGVHLGKDDMPIVAARKLLGDHFIIGGTANTVADVEELIAAGVDYVGLGPFRFTPTKQNLSSVLGSEGLARIAGKFASRVPIIAIGGIEIEDVQTIRSTGVHGIAVASGINQAVDPKAAAQHYLKNLDYVNA